MFLNTIKLIHMAIPEAITELIAAPLIPPNTPISAFGISTKLANNLIIAPTAKLIAGTYTFPNP